MNKDNHRYLKLFWGTSNQHKFKKPKATTKTVTTTVIVVFCLAATFCALAAWISSPFAGACIPNQNLPATHLAKPQESQEFSLRCTKSKNNKETKQTGPRDNYPTSHSPSNPQNLTCPS
ncbi:hypothetical protein ACUX4R_26470, partial [Salmonella enterica]